MPHFWINHKYIESWAFSNGPGGMEAPWEEVAGDSDLARLARMTELAWDLGDAGMPFGKLDVPPEHYYIAQQLRALLVERLDRMAGAAVKFLPLPFQDCYDLYTSGLTTGKSDAGGTQGGGGNGGE